jgi:superfamily II DNA or RNA helicase
MILREYQQSAVNGIEECWQSNSSTLAVMPTGCGKTVVFAEIIRRRPVGRVMVIAHREELIFQAVHKIHAVTGVHPTIEMAEMRAGQGFHEDGRVVVSTVQTQVSGRNGGRMTNFLPEHFGLLIIDEAHHATAGSYQAVLNHYKQNPNLRVLGVTATPDRADEAALGQVFESVAFDYELPQAIADGWLAPIRQRIVHVEGLDFSAIHTQQGDLAQGELESLMLQEEPMHKVVTACLRLTGDKRTLIFAVGVAQAERVAEIINRYKPDSAAFVCGKTDKQIRRDIFKSYAAGRFQFLVNVGVATEGFDEPGIQFIVMARPTKSRALYSQMAGRGTRPLPGLVDGLATAEERRDAIAHSDKCYCEILDFVGNAGRHKLITTADILGGKYPDEVAERAARKASEADGESKDMRELLEESEREIADEQARARRAAVRGRAKGVRTEEVDPFGVLDIVPDIGRGWAVRTPRAPSPAQAKCLTDAGIDICNKDGELIVSASEAHQLLDEVFGRRDKKMCTFRQAKKLQQFGYRTDLSFTEASTIMDALAKNHWGPVDAQQREYKRY